MRARRVLIMGAAGRDFHNFNVCFRDDERYEVVGFTATQIPNIVDRSYPPALAGPRYPQGIPIYDEEELPLLIASRDVDLVIFAYSDVTHEHVMHQASIALAAGADFEILGPRRTMLASRVPVVSVCAVRTGSGKSQTTRRISDLLKSRGKRVVVVRHPMPYGDLGEQAVQRFETREDLDAYRCTIEEREEYEPHLERGTVVYAGVDYGKILARAEAEAEIILWDGGNNDMPFYRPDLYVVVTDPHRAGHGMRYHPGEANLRSADVVVINKEDSASREQIDRVRETIARLAPHATVIDAASPISIDDESIIRGKRVLVIEDGPTLTHGEMTFGAGTLAARAAGAAEIVDPRPYAVGSIKEIFEQYPDLACLLPAMGYGADQVRELEETIAKVPSDTVIIATPVDLRKIISLDRPAARVTYELREIGSPNLEMVIDEFLERL
ncbi:GTPase [candidate division TA06 bacterium DG_24]|uniref:GTPase n=3 Tax=Bacteria division TA06 TaxID=1156500 RepID=A0A0S8JLS4_UNCT6|nr:MAG: GTPase [candidate division TA06 bacterium DG_24]KPK67708.1 MAG: GTPase [candidate division TA06 bacterium SM23_40]KPL10370.1 MAG: GTPase [candidate division TA06 bacterium SM1_40]